MPNIHRHSIKETYFTTLDWHSNQVVDWSQAATCFALDGSKSQLQRYHFAYSFDSAISSDCQQYAFIYQRLGTKGLLLKNGEILREINRSYYQAESYEYPAAFYTAPNGEVFLIHCPKAYCQLDFEAVETGEIPTATSDRKPADIFHSRLRLSTDQKTLLTQSWVWQPWDVAEIYDINACFQTPTLLDQVCSFRDIQTEVCSADFIDNQHIILYSSDEDAFDDEEENLLPPQHFITYDIASKTYSTAIKTSEPCGNIYIISQYYAWDTYLYPKVIDLRTGEIVAKIADIDTSRQRSAIISHLEKLPQIAYNRTSQKLAILQGKDVEILTFEP
jgi:hypothetical protein